MVSVASVGMSPREAEVLEALSDGLTNAQIGQRLHISVRTVESHVSSLLRKLGAADRRDLAARAAGTLAAVLVATEDLVGLPATWTTFVGRTVELDQLDKALATDRLVTLVGPGGVGKTRLAVMAAARAASTFFAGGAFVDLVPVSPEFVVETVAAALGVVERAPVPLDQAVLARLRAGRVLLVLDNCEHVLAATAAFTRSVLAACPEAVVLATSRQSLGVAGERVVPLDPLALTGEGGDGAVSDAERLFVERATSAAGAIADPALIGEICRRLDGMPLAIELAAARSSSLGLDGLLAGLDDHLRLLSRSTDPGDRHRSMRTVIEWSHQLLDDEERAVFRRLSLFAGAFDLDAAATVAGEGDVATTSDIIGRLADKSLLVRLGAPTGSRWRMLDTVDAYAGAQLEASGEEDAVRRRYLVWATATARQIEGSLDIDGAWRDRFDAVADDLRAALLAAAPASATQAPDESAGFELALALGHLSYARRFLVEARDHLGTAVARAPSEESAVDALRMAASAAFAEMRGKTAFDLLQTAFDRASAAGNDRAAAIALAQASAIAGRCSALFVDPLSSDEIAGFIARARALAPPDDLEVETYIAVAVAWDATHGLSLPNPAGADAALVLARRLGDPVLISIALDAVSAAAAEDGCYKQAARVTEERFTLLDRLPRHDPRFGGEVADIFHMGAESALAAGELREALENAQRSYDDSTNQGLAHFSASHLVIPLALQGAFDSALVQATIMREGWERAGQPASGWMAPSFFAAAMVHGLRGDQEEYAGWLQLATTVRIQKKGHSFSLFAEPRVALHLGALDWARATAVTDDGDMAGQYGSYARAISAEVAVVAGAPDAETRLAAAWHLGEQNDFVAAQLLRAAGRLHDDESEIKASLAGWEAIGARFERACTLRLLPARADEGAAELAALGCPLPPS